MSFPRICALLLIFEAISASVFAADLPAGFGDLPDQARAILLHNQSAIHSLQALIRQNISGPGFNEKRRGFYFASSRGYFRADYSVPEETVVFDGSQMTWKIRENPFTWVIAGPGAAGSMAENALDRRPDWLTSGFTILPEKNWLPWNSHLCEFRVSSKNGYAARISLDLEKRQIFRRILYGREGMVMMEEELSEPVSFQGEWFYTRSRVRARIGETSSFITSETRYEYPVFNRPFRSDLFRALPGPYRNYVVK